MKGEDEDDDEDAATSVHSRPSHGSLHRRLYKRGAFASVKGGNYYTAVFKHERHVVAASAYSQLCFCPDFAVRHNLT